MPYDCAQMGMRPYLRNLAVALILSLAGSDISMGAMEPTPAKPDPQITMPVDLSPNIKPEYTTAARAEGVEGTLTLEIVVSEQGKVVRAISIGKKLGFGLDQSAIRAYKAKSFKPATNGEGKPIKIKYYERIKFTLK